jgi:hypothetical protein
VIGEEVLLLPLRHSAVTEPATCTALFGLGARGFAARRKRRRVHRSG